jgi:hypothetical protein
MLFPTNVTYFENLAAFLDVEPTGAHDFPMRGFAPPASASRRDSGSARTQRLELFSPLRRAPRRTWSRVHYERRNRPETRLYPDGMAKAFEIDNALARNRFPQQMR